MTEHASNAQSAAADLSRPITEDYECKKDCRNCPFPGAKCYQSKYDRYNTGLLIHIQRGN